MLTQALEQLWRAVEQLDRPVAGSRAPGATASEVATVLGGTVPTDILAWFGFSNGVEHLPGQVQDDAFLVPGYEPLSLAESAAIRASLGPGDTVPGGHWTPLLATGGGDCYAAVHETRVVAPRVTHTMVGGGTVVVYRSIEDMVNTFCHFYRSGVFFVGDRGTLEADDEAWIAAESELGSTPH